MRLMKQLGNDLVTKLTSLSCIEFQITLGANIQKYLTK